MHTVRSLVAIRTATARCVVAFMACLFLCRALIPVGYMPDLQALRDGRMVLALCTADGTLRNVLLDLGAAGSDESGAVPDCPYGPLSSAAVPTSPDAAGGLLVGPSTEARVPVSGAQRPSWLPRGPPLGSRAPPVFLT